MYCPPGAFKEYVQAPTLLQEVSGSDATHHGRRRRISSHNESPLRMPWLHSEGFTSPKLNMESKNMHSQRILLFHMTLLRLLVKTHGFSGWFTVHIYRDHHVWNPSSICKSPKTLRFLPYMQCSHASIIRTCASERYSPKTAPIGLLNLAENSMCVSQPWHP